MRNLKPAEIIKILVNALPQAISLHRSPYLCSEAVENYQLSRIQRLVKHAYDNVPFYRKKYDEAGVCPSQIKTLADIKRLPPVTKEEVIANYPGQIVAKGTDLQDCIISKSSGSSGKVLEIAFDIESLVTYVMAGLRVFTMVMPYYPWDKQAYIYTSPYPFNSILGLYPLYFIPTVNEISDTIDRLKKIGPNLLVCYPSHLREISKMISPDDLKKIRPKAISVNSEMSTQKERDELADIFGCGVYDEYSSEELTRIAAQCTRHNYHIFEDINYLEILDENGDTASEGKLGEIVGTNLHNFSMPMIRYRQADLGSITNERCACGRNFRVLKELKGRKNDQFILPSGKILSSGFLLDASYDLILEFSGAIRDFCIIQQTLHDVTIEIIPGKAFNSEVAAKIQQRLKALIKEDVSVEVKEVTNLYKTKTGKMNPIISMINKGS